MRHIFLTFILTIFPMILAGCGSGFETEEKFYAPRVEVYKEQFREESNLYMGPSLNTLLTGIDTAEKDLGYDAGGSVVAQCTLRKIGGKTVGRAVTADLTFMNETFEYDDQLLMSGSELYGASLRKTMLFHEFGHCALERIKHNCAKKLNGHHSSIMNTYLINVPEFVADFRNYMDELFVNSPIFPAGKAAPSGATVNTVVPPEACAGESSNVMSFHLESNTTETFYTKCIDMKKHTNYKDGRRVPDFKCWHEQ